MFHELVEGLPEQIALVDRDWTILAINPAWHHATTEYGYAGILPGGNYLQFCHELSGKGHVGAASTETAIAEMEQSGSRSARFVYSGSGRSLGRDFELCINRMELGGDTFATIARYDITELTQLRRSRQEFGEAVLQEQATERRRMARELHDSTAQILTCIGLGLGQLRRSVDQEDALDLVDEIEEMLGEAQREIRSISYLAHAPQIEKLGIVDAVRALALGFAARTNLDLDFAVEGDFRLGSSNADLAAYRVVQEALSNIHRHSRAARAEVRLVARNSACHVIVADDGIGVGPEHPKGVGLSSMAARLAELGGRLRMARTPRGTAIIATFPAAG